MPSLQITDLKVNAGTKTILDGINLTVKQGKVHALMGPNGSGKSTLANVLLANPAYKIVRGKIKFGQYNLRKLSGDKIARAGIFLAFQYPQTLPGISLANLIRIAGGNRHRKNFDASEYLKQLKIEAKKSRLPEEFLSRSLNENFSGGEKKKTELLQVQMLKPKLAILDEIDSGLDIDALKTVAHRIKKLREQKTSIIIITHYNRILKFVKPDYVHIMIGGKIVKSGNKRLAEEIEKRGYNFLSAKAPFNFFLSPCHSASRSGSETLQGRTTSSWPRGGRGWPKAR